MWNLGPLCRHHHRVKQTSWAKLRARDNTVRWTSPAGRTWTSSSPHQPPQAPARPPTQLRAPGPLDGLTATEWEDELRQLDPGSPLWDDPVAHELRDEDREPDDTDGYGFPADTRWTLDLDDPYTWHDVPEPILS